MDLFGIVPQGDIQNVPPKKFGTFFGGCDWNYLGIRGQREASLILVGFLPCVAADV